MVFECLLPLQIILLGSSFLFVIVTFLYAKLINIFVLPILSYKEPDNLYEAYNPVSVSSLKALSKIKGKIDYDKLVECKKDFFLQAGMQSVESTVQSTAMLSQFASIMKELKEISNTTGVTTEDLFQQILSAASSMKSPETISD